MTAFSLEADRVEENLHGNRLPQYDPTAAIEIDPYPEYERYRTQDPVHWGKAHDPRFPGVWYLFGHAECQALFRMGAKPDAPIGGMPAKLGWDFGAQVPAPALDYFELRKRFLTAQDPPDHTRVRRVIAKYFTPARIESLRPRIEAIVSGLLDDLEATRAQRFDLIEVLGSPLPLRVVSEIMGVPDDDRDAVHEMSTDLGAAFDIDGTFERLLVAGDAARRFKSYLSVVFDAQRAAPSDDVIGGMIVAADRDGLLSDLDLFATVSILIQGGHSTTMGLIGRGVVGLLEQPDAWAQLCAAPTELAVTATEELLRWTSPAQRPPPRWTYEDIELGGRVIRKGEAIEPMVASANRDAEVFADPDRIDLTRSPNPHLAFGGGIHRCIGSTLARLQGQVVLQQLARRLPNLRLDPGRAPVLMDRRAVRALSSVPVLLG